MTTELERQIAECRAAVAFAERTIPEITADALNNDGRIDDIEQAQIDGAEEMLARARARLQALVAQYNALPREDVEQDVERPGQVEERGGIEIVGQTVTLDPEGFLTEIAAFVDVDYEVKQGSRRIGHGQFLTGGVVEIDLTRGVEYEVTMTGRAQVNDTNLVMNDTVNGQSISVTWRVKPPLNDGGSHDPSVELHGRPTISPMRSSLGYGVTDWSVLIKDVSISGNETSQTGVQIDFVLNGSSGYGGSITAGAVQGTASNTANITSNASVGCVLRFLHKDPMTP